MGLRLYGNTIWNTNVSNSSKVVILAEENKFDNILKTLEYTGLNYCAYLYKGNAHIAVNKSDIDKIQRLPIEYGAILPPSKSNTISKGNIIGNVPYKNIENKEYRKYDIDFAFKIAQRLSENNIPFSGRIYKSSTTITVDKSDIDALNNIVSVLQYEKKVFERNGSIYLYSNSENISIAAKADYFDIKISSFNELESLLLYLNDKFKFTVISTNDDIFTFYCDKGSKDNLQKLIADANENILSNQFDLFISDYKYSDEQKKAINAVKNLLSSKINDENLVQAFNSVFENTNRYSPEQLILLSNEFVNTYENLNKFECVFADNSRLNDLKAQFDNEILLADVTKNRGYSPEQIDVIKELVNRDASKIILDLLDYTFDVDDIKSFMQEFSNGNYRGLINVIAQVKHTTPFEIDALIESGEYVPELPTADSSVLINLKNYTEAHRNKISILPDERNTIVINAFAGPGAGKTTSCLEIAEKLKKKGFVTEYVQEYAKELVWDNKLDLLDGSMENQFTILQEQLNRIDRLYGKVDFIVTDSPVLLNATYLKEPNEEYNNAIQELYSHFDNFNYFVERNVDSFETEGRIHSLEQSLEIDNELKKTLAELNLEYKTYGHSTIDNIVQDAIEYKDNYSVAAQKVQLKKAQEIAEENNLPFSDKFSQGADDEIDPYVYDGSMTPENFGKMQEAVLVDETSKKSEIKADYEKELGTDNVSVEQCDYFFLHPESERVEWVYYNPDSGDGQIVQNIVSVSEMLEALNLGSLDEFLEFLSEHARQILLDVTGSEEYTKYIAEAPYEKLLWNSATQSVAELKDSFIEFTSRVDMIYENQKSQDNVVQPIKTQVPDKLELEIGFTESNLLREFMSTNYPDNKIPFALGNALFEFLDEKQHIERDIEGLTVGYYDKTHFNIKAIINGEDYGYEGRFDIGDGKENGNGSLIESIESYLVYCIENNPYEVSDEELTEMRDYLNTAIPYFKEHSNLTAEEQKVLDNFKKQYPIRTINDVEKVQDKQLEEVNEKFVEYYDTLYKQGTDTVEGYNLAVNVGDDYIKKNPIFVGLFNKLRGDIISSDRETAAFAFALADCGIIDRFVEPAVEKTATNKRNYSSTMLEYFRIKEENSDKIVLFQTGDFYEAMGEDAITISKALDLHKTKRRLNDNENIDLCGIPANKLEAYTNTLVNSGYNVAIANAVDGKYQVINKNYENTSTSKNDNKISSLENGSTSNKTKNNNTRPTITCEWSEHSDFEKGKTYSISEFDRIMENADLEWRENRQKEINKYGSKDAAINADDTYYQGYAKTKFTINMPDGTQYTERQDIGDGYGGVIDFLEQYPQYNKIVLALKADIKNDIINIATNSSTIEYKVGDVLQIGDSEPYKYYAITNVNKVPNPYVNGHWTTIYGFDAYWDKELTQLAFSNTSELPDDKIVVIERKSQNLLSDLKQENINKSAEQPIAKAINLFDIAEQTEGSASEHLSIDEVAVDVENSNTDNIATNFVITSDNSVTGAKTKFKNNFEAISTLKTLEAENRAATEEEKQILSLYSGWGGLAQAFDDKNDNWSKEYTALKNLLTADEYSSARASTLDSFYTSNEIIDSVYKALDNIGFKGGDILEPAMGIGNFFGRLPESMRNSSTLYGVEKDSLSGRISTQLYPQANITVDGFENTAFQDNSFDIAVGNIPFGDSGVNDSKYNSQNLKIHDYFFMKTLDKVRVGGIVAFVTSKGTLDKKDSSFRKTLSDKADLLGAIRLPNNAFKSAGTEVTADIIFFQKRSAPPENIPDWVQVGETSHGLPINNYFLKNPEMVLGEIVQGNKLYGRNDDTMCIPFKDISLSDLLDEAVQNIKGIYKAAQNKPLPLKIASDEIVNPPKDLRLESYFIHNDDLYFYGNTADGNVAVIPAKEILGRKCNSKNIERAKAFIELREIVRDLLEAQQFDGNDDRIKDLQGKLNTAYDNFYKKYGLIHSQTNRIIFGFDNSYPLLSSLEEKTDKDKLIKKSDIFTQRINRPAEVIEKVDTAQEALIVSINEKGCVDLAYMSSISDISQESLVAKLQGEIYPVPELSTDDNIIYQTASEYLSGDIYKKLDTAKQYSRDNPIYEANCIALEKSIPTPLKAGDIDINLGATWIDIKYYQQFMYEIFKTPNDNRVDRPPRFPWQFKGRKNIEIEYSPYTGRWNIKNASVDKSVITTKTYGTSYKNAYSILENVLNLNDPKAYKVKTDENGNTVFDKNNNPVKVLDVEMTKLLQQKANAIRREFKNWIFKDPQRRADIVDTYNRTFNCIKPREYDGSNMTFPGMNSSIELHEHQKNAIAHAIHGGNTLFAHSVGAGKTYEMIATAMESKRLGFCNKSMFCVPNHLTEQVGSDFLKLYPQANILVATKNDFTKENRQRFMAKIATGNYDAVIIGHSQLTKLPLSPERQKAVYEEQIADIIEGIRELKAENGSSFQVKAMERTRKSLEKQLEKLQSKNKDNTVYFEELGIDKLFIDEAHEFKNLLSVTKLQNVSGISSRASQRATELFMKCRYLDEKTGGKGVVFATGTPISNSVTELHTMMRYLQYDFLTSHNNMQNFDNWVSSFGVQKTDYELAPAGNKFKERTRIAEYANLPELMSMFKQTADIRTSDTLELNVPDCELHIVNVESTELQKDMVEELSMRADEVNQGNVDPTEDNMLKITSDGRKLGLDPRLIDPNLEDNPNTKLNVCVNNAFDIYSKTSDEKLTQIIFCDLGVPKGKKSKSDNDKENDDSKSISELDSLEETSAFCIYDDIKDKLISKGVPENEIAFIHDANTEQQKAELFAKVRSGEVRILLGSTGKMGTGTNVQDRIIAMHDLDVPWRPSDLEQRRGRMVRQGNINKKVHLYRYVTQGTFDAYSYQILEKKQKFISQVMTSKTPARRCSDIDQEALTYSEIKALCTGDERIKEKLTLENRVKELSLYKTEYTNTKYELEDKVSSYKGKREKLCNRIDSIKIDIEKSKSIPLNDDNTPVFKATIGGVEYTDRSEAAKALGVAVSSAKAEHNKGKALSIGDINGFSVEIIDKGYFLSNIEATISGAAHYTVDFGISNFANLVKLEKSICSLDKLLQEQINELNKLDADYESAKIMLAKPFEFEDELRQKTERLEAVTDELNLKAAQVKNSEVKQNRTSYFGKNFILNKKGKNQSIHDADIQLKSANKKHDVSI